MFDPVFYPPITIQPSPFRRRPSKPCAECDGEGRIHGRFTTNPSERDHWEECETCDGRGQIEIEAAEEEE